MVGFYSILKEIFHLYSHFVLHELLLPNVYILEFWNANMQIDSELTQKSHYRFNECFRNVLSFLIFSGFINVIGLTASIIITVNSFRYKAEV